MCSRFSGVTFKRGMDDDGNVMTTMITMLAVMVFVKRNIRVASSGVEGVVSISILISSSSSCSASYFSPYAGVGYSYANSTDLLPLRCGRPCLA